MPDEAPDLNAASQAVADIPAPVAEPVQEPSELDADLPEGDTFPREYVEKLRREAAEHRVRAREIESKFDGYTPEEKSRYLTLVEQLRDDPESALEEFEGVTSRLRKQLGKEIAVADEAPTPVPEPKVAPTGLSEEDIGRIVAERLAAEKAEAAQQSDVERTFAEAEALDDSYKTRGGKAMLFAVAQEMGGTLAEAHESIQAQKQAEIEAAVAEFQQGLRTGAKHPPRLPTGDGAVAEDKGPPKTLEEAKARAEERFNAIYGT